MVRSRSKAWGCAAALAILAGVSAPSRAGFAIRDLGVIVSTGTSGATGINASGQTSGMVSTPSGGITAASSSAGGTLQTLSLPPGAASSMATGISGGGTVAGYFDDVNMVRHGFVGSSTGPATVISPLSIVTSQGTQYGTYTQANGISSGGQVVGTGDLPNGNLRAFYTSGSGSGSPIVINPLARGTYDMGLGINSSGTVVGASETSPGGLVHAFYTDKNYAAVDLITPTSAGNFTHNSYAKAIANNGDIVGYGDVGAHEHAFYAPSGGALVDLGSLSSDESSQAEAVNNMALVVGESYYGASPSATSSLAFLWGASNGMVDLNTLISPADRSQWLLTSATGINDSDQISGTGYLNGVLHGFVLTPIAGESIFTPAGTVPAPPALVLSSLGLSAASVWSRMRFRRERSGGRAVA